MIANVLFLVFQHGFLFYTDPGSGALLLQLIAGAILGGLFYLRKFKSRFFKKRSPEIKELAETKEEEKSPIKG